MEGDRDGGGDMSGGMLGASPTFSSHDTSKNHLSYFIDEATEVRLCHMVKSP